MDSTPDSTTTGGPSGSTSSNSTDISNEAFKMTKLKENQRRPLDWQINKQNLGERGQYLLETGVWSDCTFIVGLPPTVRVFKCHKMFLAMASPVFEAMFFGGLAESSGNTGEIKILDVQPDAFCNVTVYLHRSYKP